MGALEIPFSSALNFIIANVIKCNDLNGMSAPVHRMNERISYKDKTNGCWGANEGWE